MAIYDEMPQGKPGRKGGASHIYLDKEQGVVLDAIAAAMGKRHLGFQPKRSQLIATAIRNFVAECEEAEEDLRDAIQQARLQTRVQKDTTSSER